MNRLQWSLLCIAYMAAVPLRADVVADVDPDSGGTAIVTQAGGSGV